MIDRRTGKNESGRAPNAGILGAMVENMPIAAMLCDLEDFRITYMNQATRDNLEKIKDVLPVPPEQILGQSIDIFHKDPAHQRAILSDPKNLPYKARIEVGAEVLDLYVSAIMHKGKYVGPMLTWSVVTKEAEIQRQTYNLLCMLDEMPVNVMMIEQETFEITYINRTSIETLRGLEHLLPCRADQLKGQCIDIFHKNPAHQRALLADPGNLPHRAKIELGDEILDLKVAAIMDDNGNYIAPMLTWQVDTKMARLTDNFEQNVGSVVQTVSSAATELESSAVSIVGTTEESKNQSAIVVSAAEELRSSIEEISRQAAQSATIANNAVDHAGSCTGLMGELQDNAKKIGEVVTLIQEIAAKTNLLALNATIEAARAGEHGRGFAVVANEVKGLANQTAGATDNIVKRVDEMQDSTRSAVEAIDAISAIITEMQETSAAISAAVEQQGAATGEVSSNMTGVSDAANATNAVATGLRTAAGDLSARSGELSHAVAEFLEEVRAR